MRERAATIVAAAGALAVVLSSACSRQFSSPQSSERPLSAYADQADLAPFGSTQIHASGGDGHYGFTLVDAGSGATVTASGRYTAGTVGNLSDEVVVSDGTLSPTSVTIRVGPPLQISPGASSTNPSHSLTFLAQGGEPPYTFAMALGGNPSFGGVTPAGVYTSGPNPNEADLIQVTDQNGAVVTASVAVGDTLVGIDSEAVASLITGDFNGDGRTDLVVLGIDSLQVLLGTVTNPVTVQDLALPIAVAIGGPLGAPQAQVFDENGDGNDDLLFRTSDGGAVLMLGSFTGELVAPAGWPADPTFAGDGGWIWDHALVGLQSPVPGEPGWVAAPFMQAPMATELQLVLFGEGPGLAGVLGPEFPLEQVGQSALDLSAVPSTSAPYLPGLWPAVRVHPSGSAVAFTWFDPGTLTNDVLATWSGVEADGGVSGFVAAPALDCPSSIIYDNWEVLDVNGDGIPDLYTVVEGDSPALCVDLREADGGFGPAELLPLPAMLTALFTPNVLPADRLSPVPRFLLPALDGGEVGLWADGGLTARLASIPDSEIQVGGDFNGDGVADLAAITGDGVLDILLADASGGFRTGRSFHFRPLPIDELQYQHLLAPAGDATFFAKGDGVLVLAPSPGGRLSLEEQSFSGQLPIAGSSIAVDRSEAWFEPGEPSTGIVARLASSKGGWTATSYSVPSDWVLHGALSHTGPWSGSVLLMTSVLTSGWLAAAIGADGGMTAFPIPALQSASAAYPLSVGGTDAGLDALVAVEAEEGTLEVFMPSPDGGLSWSDSPTTTVSGAQFGSSYTSVSTQGLLFPLRVGDAPDALVAYAAGAAQTGWGVVEAGGTNVVALGYNLDPNRIAVGDFTGDGLTDLLAYANQAIGQPYLPVLFTQGDGGSFQASTTSLPPSEADDLMAMDLNGDGLADLVEIDDPQGTMTAYLNVTPPGGSLTFQ